MRTMTCVRYLLIVTLLAASCGGEAPYDYQHSSQELLCASCLPGISGPPPCSTVCGSSASCGAGCTLSSGAITTCGSYGLCAACSTKTCSSQGKCSFKCRTSGGAIKRCTDWSYAVNKDADLDGLPDQLELDLAKKFYPILNMHCGTYRGWTYGSKGQFYGSNVRCGTISGAQLPVAVRKVGKQANGWCANNECIEIVYGLAYASDLGDSTTTLGEHAGDSEMYAVLVAYRRPGTNFAGSEWGSGVSYATALTSAKYWARIKAFAAAHMCDPHLISYESSSFHRPSYYSGGVYKQHALTPGTVWVSAGKNASYFSARACDLGGYRTDYCGGTQRCLLDRLTGAQRLTNVGEVGCHPSNRFDYLIPSAGPSTGHCGTANGHNVWSGAKYGGASSWYNKLRNGIIDWGRETHRCL